MKWKMTHLPKEVIIPQKRTSNTKETIQETEKLKVLMTHQKQV
jgi:hypothetical protein